MCKDQHYKFKDCGHTKFYQVKKCDKFLKGCLGSSGDPEIIEPELEGKCDDCKKYRS